MKINAYKIKCVIANKNPLRCELELNDKTFEQVMTSEWT